MSDTSEVDDTWGEASEDKQMIFVSLLSRYKVLLSRSHLPEIKALKTIALRELKLEYECSTGVVLSHKQLVKKMHNMKNEVRQKSKSDLVKPLKEWEEGLLKLLHAEGNCMPSACIFCMKKVTPGKSVKPGVEKSPMEVPRTETVTPPLVVVKRELDEDITDNPPTKRFPSQVTSLPETEETVGLSLEGLQRLVLLEQLKLIRLQQQQVALDIGETI